VAAAIAALLMLSAALFALAPLVWGSEDGPADQREGVRLALLGHRDALVREMRESRLDHALGKLPDEELEAQETRLKAALVDVMKKLDHVDPNDAAVSAAGSKDSE
jgi:hypothetical protein